MDDRFFHHPSTGRLPNFIAVGVCLFLAALACNLPLESTQEEVQQGLNLAPRTSDGTVRGSYGYPDSLMSKSVRFEVSADGSATFQVEGAPASEKLTVSAETNQLREMNWSGLSLDGYGSLSGEEQSALEALGASELLHGLSLIPLEAACLSEDQIEPQQLAALLFPLQMVIKYQVPERATAAEELMSLSSCMTGSAEDNPAARRAQIYLTAADPFPIVLGYFPFDAEGAIEGVVSGLPGRGLARLVPFRAPGLAPLMAGNVRVSSPPGGHQPEIRDQWGPCEAKCRGACGPNCTSNNCRMTADYRCEVDDLGRNTGKISYISIYDCGLHPACIKHDQCYDDCNQQYGCGTFKAAHCRHGGWADGVNLPDNYYCDKHTVNEESLSNVRGWVDGFGPQPIRQVYIYTDDNMAYQDDLENCPIPTAEAEPEPVVVPSATEKVPQVLIYEGVVSKTPGQDFEVLDSQVRIEVSGERVTVTIEMTFRAAVRWTQNQDLCTATMNRVYTGQGSLGTDIEIKIDLQSHQDSLEGSDCKDAFVPVITTQTLTGTFHEDGRFTGAIGKVWVIYALNVEE